LGRSDIVGAFPGSQVRRGGIVKAGFFRLPPCLLTPRQLAASIFQHQVA
jgi:hypothetical protein